MRYRGDRSLAALKEKSHPLFQKRTSQDARHVENLEIEPAVGTARPPFFRDPAQVLGGDHGHVGASAVGCELPDPVHCGVVGVRDNDQEAGDRITRVADIALELPQVGGRKRIGRSPCSCCPTECSTASKRRWNRLPVFVRELELLQRPQTKREGRVLDNGLSALAPSGLVAL